MHMDTYLVSQPYNVFITEDRKLCFKFCKVCWLKGLIYVHFTSFYSFCRLDGEQDLLPHYHFSRDSVEALMQCLGPEMRQVWGHHITVLMAVY